ncbi:MAG: hypothetical protein JST86_05625 [Bacteroidetes bacterium]|nr:hypothetical protein [Bacteroidota bacterium]
MKPVNNIAQLKREQVKLLKEKYELEQQLEKDWKALKYSVMPATAVKNLLSISSAAGTANNPLLKEIISFGISCFAKKMADKAWYRISILLHKT